MSSGLRVAKNALLLMGATTGQKIVSFLAFYVVSDHIGPTQIGIYLYAISIISIFVVIGDLGMTQVVIRAIAGNRDDSSRLLGAVLRAKLFLIPAAVIAALIYTGFDKSADRIIWTAVIIACFIMIADSLHLTLYGVLRGRQQLRSEAIGMFVGQVITAVLSVTTALVGFGPIGLVCALLAGSVWNVSWVTFQLKKADFSPARPRRTDFQLLIKEALPFALAGISVKVYSYVDSLFLKHFHNETAVGLYGVAYKLTYALQFLPLTFTAALYPALASSYANKQEEELRQTFTGSLRLMGAIGFPLSAGLSALAAKIIPFLYEEEYFGSILPLEILPWVLLPIFLDFPIGAILNATHRAYLKTVAMVVTMVVNIILNLWLVPLYGPVGAAWAGVGSFWGLYIIGAWFTRVQAGGLSAFAWLTFRALIAAAVSWYAWHEIGASMHLIPAAIFGGAIALLMAFIAKLITVDDVYIFIRRFRPAPQKVDTIHD